MIKFRQIAATLLLALLAAALLTPQPAAAASGWVGNSTQSAYAINAYLQPGCTGLRKVLNPGARQLSPRALSVRVNAPSQHKTYVDYDGPGTWGPVFAANRCVTLSGAVDLTSVLVFPNG